VKGFEAISAPPSPFWSVIVPLYERRDFLPQCLDSVLSQDPGPAEMEICIADDASPNDLREFAEELGRGRVQYVRNDSNLGLYPSTNRAIRRARGRWLHILHDDDWVLRGFYATMRQGIESGPGSVGVAMCMYSNLNTQHNSWWSPEPFRTDAGLLGKEFLVRLARACPLNLSAVVYRRESFERVGLFREDLPCTADWEWYVRSALQVDWHYQPETLACYRVHSENQSHALARTGQDARDIRRTLELFAGYLPPDVASEVLPVAQEYHARKFFLTALTCARTGQLEMAKQFATEALAIDPEAVARPGFARLLGVQEFEDWRKEIRAILMARQIK
jgi:glycosyltransferase involved in cell wall biosynthesis